VLAAAPAGLPARPAPRRHLEKARDSGKLTIGYAAMPALRLRDAAAKPAGYAISLCDKVADAVKAQLNLPALSVNYVPVTRDERFRAVQQGRIDLLCGAVPSLERARAGRLLDPDRLTAPARPCAPTRRRGWCRAGGPRARRLARVARLRRPGAAARAAGRGRRHAAREGMLARAEGAPHRGRVVPVKDTEAGMQLLASQGADAFFLDRALLLDAVRRAQGAGNVQVLDRVFRRDLVALAVRRDDDDFRCWWTAPEPHVPQPGNRPLYAQYFGRHAAWPWILRPRRLPD
jgi:ABC-type amino acid transport substrate-binding protein